MSNLPELQSPSYILSTPLGIQRFALGLFLAAAGGTILWLAGVYLHGEMGTPHWIAGGIAILLVLVLAQPRAWRPWVSFAADRRGLYIRWPDYSGFLFVPWEDVGETEVGWTTGMTGGHGILGVRIRLCLDEADWKRLTGMRSLLFMQPDEQGWGRINIGNSTRDPCRIQVRIEEIRAHATPEAITD
ncbi:hypothetical protein QVG61_04080 [Thiohalobacter sp. IOR34]|uniref:hypothetical protein n=1 Tax=Thiohalobacter sp. IOR34 TaxID=3057176 RepID=UPI0025B2425E|nr:hypothetical protein [Thiohalobacter sp. IOR34]WJW76279.1 hypothetical protein QVG61_04080 [Thiohalobacter sp. IOR34]